MLKPDIIDKYVAKSIRSSYDKFTTMMEEQLEFHLADSKRHDAMHCERVLVHALTIGDARALPERDMEMLGFASIFHDTRRHNDGLDPGHGMRAAEYYREFCEQQGLEFFPETFWAMAYHDRRDELGERVIAKESNQNPRWILLYHILKDADALDRHRLGAWGLNEDFLRTKEALERVAFSKALYFDSIK